MYNKCDYCMHYNFIASYYARNYNRRDLNICKSPINLFNHRPERLNKDNNCEGFHSLKDTDEYKSFISSKGCSELMLVRINRIKEIYGKIEK